jgi:hypothetical protein
MARDYDRSEAFPPLGPRSDMGTLFGPTMVLVAVTVALFTLGAYLARDLSSGWAAGDATRRDLSGLARGRWWALVALIAFRVVLVHDVPADRTIRLAVAAMANEVAIAATEPS